MTLLQIRIELMDSYTKRNKEIKCILAIWNGSNPLQCHRACRYFL